MFTSTLSLGLALLPFVSGAIHNIMVGEKGELAYSPVAIGAVPGDQVIFHFKSKNHTVTQSSFANPCKGSEYGFDSGFTPVPANQTDHFPTFTVHVPDTKPIWVFCRQASGTPNDHCGKGMVFAINCGADDAPNSLKNFKDAALAYGASLGASAPTPSSGGYGGGYGGGAGQNAPTTAYTAAYGGITIAPPPNGVLVTQSVTVEGSSWVTTYTSYAGSPAPTPASLEGNEIRVIVGASGLTFDPPNVIASPRDTVTFEFRQKNHTVTQSSFEAPCLPMPGGVDSGFIPVAAGATDFPTWSIKINDTAPLYMFCRQGNHCGSGMVFTVNADEKGPRNNAAFKQVAQALNGTTLAANAPQPSGNTGNSAVTSARIGGTGLIAVVAMVFTLLL